MNKRIRKKQIRMVYKRTLKHLRKRHPKQYKYVKNLERKQIDWACMYKTIDPIVELTKVGEYNLFSRRYLQRIVNFTPPTIVQLPSQYVVDQHQPHSGVVNGRSFILPIDSTSYIRPHIPTIIHKHDI